MSDGFEKARTAFRDYAIKALGTSAINSGPNAATVKLPQNTGNALAFNAALQSDPQKMVRGWALPDGRVITVQQNFGLLLAEAGLWATPRSDLAGLPKLVAWSMGNDYTANEQPKLTIGADGSGTIAFELISQQAGGGGSLGPQIHHDFVVTIAKDHTATVTITKKS